MGARRAEDVLFTATAGQEPLSLVAVVIMAAYIALAIGSTTRPVGRETFPSLQIF